MMSTAQLMGRFARIGARLNLHERTELERRNAPLTLDVRSDEGGEYFDVRLRLDAPPLLDVVDVSRRERHLLLRAQERAAAHYYLCGHDEQHWFVAAIPESAGQVANVHAAMEALKPPAVLEAQRRQGIKGKARQARKNAAFVRQGEWFFLPVPKLRVNKEDILRNEPLSRGVGSKPHWAQFLFRDGGVAVHVCDEYPAGLAAHEYAHLLEVDRRTRKLRWRVMFRDPQAYVKGTISHPDHKTITLQVWHRVVMNTEGQSQAMRHVVFLD